MHASPSEASTSPAQSPAAKGTSRSRTISRNLLLTCCGGALLLFLNKTQWPSPPVVHMQQRQEPQPTIAASAAASPPPPAPGESTTAATSNVPAIAIEPYTARIGLLMLVVGSTFPPWWPFLVASYARNYPTYQLIVVHTGEVPTARVEGGVIASAADDVHNGRVRYEHVPFAALQQRFISKLGASTAQVEAKFASGKGLSDLKPFYGRVFDDLLPEAQYTHWGWVDWDVLVGDLKAVVPERLLWAYDALTFPGATLGFAWAGQFSILRNTPESRTLYTAVQGYLPLGFKTGSGEQRQSGWEERVLLREVLRSKPAFSILFHMSAQFDYKAQWLTWVPFDRFWDRGKVWRCAKRPLSRPGRPTLLVENHTRWLHDVQQIQSDPRGFEKRKDGRVCIRWDLESSPWRCCPHSMGVGYVARGIVLEPMLLHYNNASDATRVRLAAAAKAAAVRPREPSGYDVCQEGAFFHAGLQPKGGIGGSVAPSCTSGTWALQDDIGRFSGSLSLLKETCSP